MKNIELKERYEKLYRNTTKASFSPAPEHLPRILVMCEWKDADVLEIGCGKGDLAFRIASSGAKRVLAIDYSSEAIKICKAKFPLKNLEFREADIKDTEGRFDIVVMQGILEHLDRPFQMLDNIIKNNLKKGGCVISSSPSFLNLRGYIWMTLQLLFDIPMSLTDVHFLCPFDFEEFCKKKGYALEYISIEQDWGCGEKLITDYKKRLRNALRDKGMKGDVARLLKWLKKAIQYKHYDMHTGAIVIYKITRKKWKT